MSQAVKPVPQDHELDRVRGALSAQIRGRDPIVELALAALLARGHLLLEGPPGTGKTSLAKAMAQAFGGTFRRIQMTSDLLPSDVVGILRLRPGENEFEFREGPIFSNFLLADELNRTSPKTQSALLEAMAEGTVTVDGKTYPLPEPFFVVATQNPIESHGVYPLAESQLDRFMLKLEFHSPERSDELEIYQSAEQSDAAERSTAMAGRPLLELASLRQLAQAAWRVYVEPTLLEYVADLVRATRVHPEVSHGVSVRGGLLLIRAAKGLAFVRGRDFVIPKDISDLALPALSHRLCFRSGEPDSALQRHVMREIVDRVQAPK